MRDAVSRGLQRGVMALRAMSAAMWFAATVGVVASAATPLAHTLGVSHSSVLHAQGVATGNEAPPAPGVSAALDSARALRGASLTVSLYTYGPSDVFFERFGHAAVGVYDSSTGQDIAFNWGMFDFNQPNFLLRFLTGDTKYSMAGFPTALFNNVYRGDNRSIRQQVLALTAVEKAALQDYVQWFAREENKYYRYDYYSDNCSTRIRDLLDRTLGGRVRPALDSAGSGRTWRGETARVLEYNLPLYAGIEIALGRHADEPLTRWNEEFLPDHMADHLAALVLRDASGRRYRLVEQDTVLFTATRVPLPAEPPSWLPMAALAGLTLAGLTAALADARSRAARVILGVAVATWYLVGGLLGTALLLAATVTKHAPYMGANTTLLSLQPLLLFAAVVVPLALVRGTPSRAAMGLSAVIAVLSLLGVCAQLVPAFAQASGVVLAVVVPVHVAIAIAVWRLGSAHGLARQAARAGRRA